MKLNRKTKLNITSRQKILSESIMHKSVGVVINKLTAWLLNI